MMYVPPVTPASMHATVEAALLKSFQSGVVVTIKEKCSTCHAVIEVMAHRLTGTCSILCAKVKSGELTAEQADHIRKESAIAK